MLASEALYRIQQILKDHGDIELFIRHDGELYKALGIQIDEEDENDCAVIKILT